ncbi:hypothetical protein [Microvirga massiliensis]|uniref:hypothetical protein n=1 Tax=Microvirga massiliensis TaxID=1033741 RepID=UPI00062BE7A4|nr:hypothetical protein [Microvirga massiliensis]
MIDLKGRLAAALIEHSYPIVGCLHEVNRPHCASVHYPRCSPSTRREHRDNSHFQDRSLGSPATVSVTLERSQCDANRHRRGHLLMQAQPASQECRYGERSPEADDAGCPSAAIEDRSQHKVADEAAGFSACGLAPGVGCAGCLLVTAGGAKPSGRPNSGLDCFAFSQ